MLSQNSKLMADLMKKPGHTDPLQGKNQDHVEKIVPERVFLFLCLLFEGMDILAGLIENLLEPWSLSSSQCFSLACNTWLWYFQASRLENLVQLFNAESHANWIKPVHGIDDAIAKFVFEKCVEKMDMYISLLILT